MSLTSEQMKQLMEAGLSAEQMIVVARMMEEKQAVIDMKEKEEEEKRQSKREATRNRVARYRSKKEDVTHSNAAVTQCNALHDVTSVTHLSPFPSPPFPPPTPPPITPHNPIPIPQPIKRVRAGEKPVPVTLENLSVDHIRDWLAQKRMEGKYLNHDEHQVLEVFKDYCISNGKRYKDYIAAFRNAFGWERFELKGKNYAGSKTSGPTAHDNFTAGIAMFLAEQPDD